MRAFEVSSLPAFIVALVALALGGCGDAPPDSDPARPAVLQGHSGGVAGVAFSPGGRTFVSGGDDGTVRLWEVRGRAQVGEPIARDIGEVSGVAFSADGHTVAAGANKTIRLWDVRTRKPLGAPLEGHTHPVTEVAFSPDGRMLASRDDYDSVRLWDVRTHKQLGVALQGRTTGIAGVVFSPDGRRLATSRHDRTIGLWDVRTHKPAGAEFKGHRDTSTTSRSVPTGAVWRPAPGTRSDGPVVERARSQTAAHRCGATALPSRPWRSVLIRARSRQAARTRRSDCGTLAPTSSLARY